ncbi:MAG: serine/threonine-protein kinase, partial [Pseudomonadota bacterium]
MSDLLHHLALPVGYVVADYRIERLLGAGGFGITYLAQDLSLDKQVAVKEYFPNDMAVRREGQSVLAKTSADDDGFRWGLEEFLAEARRLARFDHPNIIKIHRYFEAHGTAYIVMEFAEGITLAERLITEGTLDEAAVRAIFGPLADGLATVHAAGLLHRDIKPGNIILRADGRPVLIDFGAARHATGGRSHSVTAIVSGGYSPFEQYSTTGNQGPWTDVYAFGSVIYTSMTGNRMPPAPDRIADRQGVLDAERFAALTGRASPALMEMIKRSLQVYAEDRPSTMSAWQACFSGSPEAVEPVTMEVSPNPPDASPEVENPYASSGVGSGYSAAEAVAPTIEPVKAGSVHAAPKQGKQPVGLLAGIGVLVLALLGVGVYQLFGEEEDTPVALVTPDPATDPA